jgi:hypothetical protein
MVQKPVPFGFSILSSWHAPDAVDNIMPTVGNVAYIDEGVLGCMNPLNPSQLCDKTWQGVKLSANAVRLI